MKELIKTILGFLFVGSLHAQCVPSYGFDTRQVQVDSLRINYIEQGKGQPLLMIHGLGGNASHWKRNIATLAAQYRCIAVDLPGYGSSAAVTRTEGIQQLDFYVDVIAGLLKKLNIQKAVVMGHSMGGQISIILALKYPALVNKLVLLAPAGLETFSTTEAGILRAYATPAFFEKQDSAAIAGSYRSNFFRMPEEAQLLVKERIALKQCPAFAIYCAQIPLGVQGMLGHPVKEQLKHIMQPVLILFGTDDALIPNKFLHPTLTVLDVAEVGKAMPNAAVKMITQAGHLLQFEKSEDVNKAVLQFLQ